MKKKKRKVVRKPKSPAATKEDRFWRGFMCGAAIYIAIAGLTFMSGPIGRAWRAITFDKCVEHELPAVYLSAFFGDEDGLKVGDRTTIVKLVCTRDKDVSKSTEDQRRKDEEEVKKLFERSRKSLEDLPLFFKEPWDGREWNP